MQNPPPVADQKTEIRRLALARRRQLSDSGRIAASQRIGERVLDLISTEYSANPHIIVAGYWPIRDELDPRLAMQALEQAGFSLALPVIAGQSLRFRRYRTGDLLVAGRFNTFEPAPDCETVTPACVLVPLVAFDGQCQRLGYGAGFYDRMLAGFGAARPLTLGLAYECQYLAELPVDGHDQPLDLVLTESDLRRRRGHETR
jgi:5-formyltetrahydrofolate cyclo-ligase